MCIYHCSSITSLTFIFVTHLPKQPFLEVLLQTFSIFVDFANAGYYLSSNRWFVLNYCAFQSSLFAQCNSKGENCGVFTINSLLMSVVFWRGFFYCVFPSHWSHFSEPFFGHFHSMSESKRLKAPWFLWVGCSPLFKTQAVLGQLGRSTQTWIPLNHFC